MDTHGERGATAYNGDLGAKPQRGPGTEPLVRGLCPPEAENLLAFGCPTEAANLPHSLICKLPKPQVFVIHLSKNQGIVHDGTDNTVYQQKSSLEL